MSRQTYTAEICIRVIVEADGSFDHEDLQRMFTSLVNDAMSVDRLTQEDGRIVSLANVGADFLDDPA